jgi:hypothetical protein
MSLGLALLIGITLATLGSGYMENLKAKKSAAAAKEQLQMQIEEGRRSRKEEREFLKKQREKEQKEQASQKQEIAAMQQSKAAQRDLDSLSKFLGQQISQLSQAGVMSDLGFSPGGLGPVGPGIGSSPQAAMGGGSATMAAFQDASPEMQASILNRATGPAPTMGQALYRLGIPDYNASPVEDSGAGSMTNEVV